MPLNFPKIFQKEGNKYIQFYMYEQQAMCKIIDKDWDWPLVRKV